MTTSPRIAVLGLGNTLAGDDGVGPRVVELLQQGHVFSPDVELLDVGTPGLNLTDHLFGLDVAVLVDAIVEGTGAADVRVYRGAEARGRLPLERSGAHDAPLARSLAALELAGCGPRELVLVGVGIGPRQCELGAELSRPAQTAVDHAAAVVRHELARLGVVCARADARVMTGARPKPVPVPRVGGAVTFISLQVGYARGSWPTTGTESASGATRRPTASACAGTRCRPGSTHAETLRVHRDLETSNVMLTQTGVLRSGEVRTRTGRPRPA